MSDSLLQLWERLLRTQPERPVLIEAASATVLTVREIDARAHLWLNSLGPMQRPRPGEWVVFAKPNDGRWWRLFVGLLRCGAVPVPLDPGESLIAQRVVAEGIGAHWWWTRQSMEKMDTRRRRLPETALVKLTSGSTQVPRALPFTAAQLSADSTQIRRTMGLTAADVNLGLVPFGHSYGLGNLVLPLLQQGTAILCPSAALPHALALDIQRWKVTVCPVVPTIIRSLAQTEIEPALFASVRLWISAGSVLAPEVAQAFTRRFQRGLHSFYGSSETGGITFDRTGLAAANGSSVGKVLRGVRLTETRGGRFWVESAAVWGSGRWQPADRGTLLATGELVLQGRTGRVVKLGGKRLDLGEVEAQFRRLPHILEAWAATDRTDPEQWGVVVQGSAVPPGTFRAQLLAQGVAAWKIPRRIVVQTEWPLTARGKANPTRLREILFPKPEK